MSDNEQKNENREKVADIVAEMRYGTIPKHRTDHELLAIYADRIEAAWKRERAKVEADALAVGGIVEAARTAEKSSAVGNAAAILEALRKINRLCGIGTVEVSSFEIGSICDAALSAPARNCDVGTAEEQAERMRLYCNSHGEDESGCFRCEKCPFLTDERCELAWAQMPYEAQEGDGL